MSIEEAERLAEFVKDHDKRFEAKVHREGAGSVVVLTQVSDGVLLEPVGSTEEYRERWIEENDPGPTVRASWEHWISQETGGQ